MLRSAPKQLQAAMGAVIEATRRARGRRLGTGEAYDAYRAFCSRAGLRAMTGRAFGDLLVELDMYSLLRSRVLSRGRYGRTREIVIDLSDELVSKIYDAILLNFEMRGHPGPPSRGPARPVI